MHGTLMLLSQGRRNYTPASVSTASGPGHAVVPTAYSVMPRSVLEQSGRLRTQGSLPLAVLTRAGILLLWRAAKR